MENLTQFPHGHITLTVHDTPEVPTNLLSINESNLSNLTQHTPYESEKNSCQLSHFNKF